MDANEALKRLEETTAEAARSAQEHLDRGVHPEIVALHLTRMTDGLPAGVKLAQIGDLIGGMSDEQLDEAAGGMSDETIAKMEQMIAVAKAKQKPVTGTN